MGIDAAASYSNQMVVEGTCTAQDHQKHSFYSFSSYLLPYFEFADESPQLSIHHLQYYSCLVSKCTPNAPKRYQTAYVLLTPVDWIVWIVIVVQYEYYHWLLIECEWYERDQGVCHAPRRSIGSTLLSLLERLEVGGCMLYVLHATGTSAMASLFKKHGGWLPMCHCRRDSHT